MASGAAVGGSPIRFGTSGWRGVLGDDITLQRVAAAATAVADWLDASGARGAVVVAHDRRFGGARLADRAAGVLAARGRPAVRGREAVATPVAAHAVRDLGAAAGLVFTASHNPASDHGLKLLDARGGSAPVEVTRRVEALAARALAGSPAPARAPGGGRRDLAAPYRAALAGFLDRERLAAGGLRVLYDALHGAGAGVLDAVLADTGVAVETLCARRDWRFGGSAPDPTPERLADLARRVAADSDVAVGLATDGDADRYAVLDADGAPLSETQAVALLVDHLARTGRVKRGVAISTATGSLVERVAAEHGLPVQRHPIGFKHMAEALARGEADVAGEESGGFAVAPFGYDKDGILAACLLCEIAAEAPLRRRLRGLERRLGASACGRTAVPAAGAACDALARLHRDPPRRVGDAPVRAVDDRDGLRLELDDGFLMLRASGTEGVLRVYAEAPHGRGLARRLGLGRAWLTA